MRKVSSTTMEKDDAAVILAMLLCLGLAILGLYIGSGDQAPNQRIGATSTPAAKIMTLD